MFASAFKERDLVEIPIGGVKSGILRKLVEFCYTSKIDIGMGDIDEMTAAAVHLQFNQVKEQCTEFYTTHLRPSNCLGIQLLAEQYELLPLKETVKQYILDYFGEIVQCEEFHHLGRDALLDMLKSDELNVETEEDALNAAMKWIEFDVVNRKTSFNTLMDCVRFQHTKDSVSQLELCCHSLFAYGPSLSLSKYNSFDSSLCSINFVASA